MKKTLLMIVAILLIGIIGCSKTKEEEKVSEEKVVEKVETVEVPTTPTFEDILVTEIMDKEKINYETALTQKMEPLEAEIQVALDSGITSEMQNGVSTLLEAWNTELSRVYDLIMVDEKFSTEEKEKLNESQKVWAEEAEKAADKSAKELEGGSYAELVFINTLLEETKEKALELAKIYDEMQK